MAHPTWTIPSHSSKTGLAGATISSRIKKAPAGASESFAEVMAKEQNNTAKNTGKETAVEAKASSSANKAASQSRETAAQKKPVVARLPEPSNVFQNAVLAGRSPNDLLRLQNLGKANSDIGRIRAINDIAGSMVGGATSLDIARGLGAAKNLRTIAASNNGKGFALTSNDFIHTSRVSGEGKVSRASRSKKSRGAEASGIGKLSAKFESGGAGSAAIGYDRTGGTSYGKYQIASRVGSMKSFLNFLDGEAPDLAKRLRSSGPANTGSRQGAMPREWRAIAAEQPERFERLQESFIMETHYKPALSAIEKSTGVDASSLSTAMREVIWSTAVQHGPAGAARIFARADDMSGKSNDAGYERRLINNVYTVRAGQFGSSTHQVRNAVRNRFREEKQIALNMLDGAGRANLA